MDAEPVIIDLTLDDDDDEPLAGEVGHDEDENIMDNGDNNNHNNDNENDNDDDENDNDDNANDNDDNDNNNENDENDNQDLIFEDGEDDEEDEDVIDLTLDSDYDDVDEFIVRVSLGEIDLVPGDNDPPPFTRGKNHEPVAKLSTIAVKE